MRIEYPSTVAAEARHIVIDIPVDEEDIEHGGVAMIPGFRADESRIRLRLNLDTGRVVGWPAFVGADLYVKVRDQGSYQLRCSQDRLLAERQGYVPRCVPREGGDYVSLQVLPDGTVLDWQPTAAQVVESFWPEAF